MVRSWMPEFLDGFGQELVGEPVPAAGAVVGALPLEAAAVVVPLEALVEDVHRRPPPMIGRRFRPAGCDDLVLLRQYAARMAHVFDGDPPLEVGVGEGESQLVLELPAARLDDDET